MTDRRAIGIREFEILVTLVAGPKHGYGIMDELRETDSGNRILGPGTLYRLLKELAGKGLIAVADSPAEDSGGPPRRYYRLTAKGQRAAATEAHRLAGLVARARPLIVARAPKTG